MANKPYARPGSREFSWWWAQKRRRERQRELPFLEQYSGAAAAYSLRDLTGDSLSVVRVRRSSDNTEQDFTANQINDGSLLTFVGSGDGLVTTWYDQSGNGNDATQDTASDQPKIVDGGVLVTEGGKAVLDFPADAFVKTASPFPQLLQNYFLNYTAKFQNSVDSNPRFITNRRGTSDDDTVFGFNTNSRFFSRAGETTYGSSVYTTEGVLLTNSHYANSSSQYISHNGQAEEVFSLNEPPVSTSSLSDTGFYIGAGYMKNTFVAVGKAFEVILYPSDQSANRKAIESNINAYYGIY